MTIEQQCTKVTDCVVPEYPHDTRDYGCGGHVARRWQAAWDGACVAVGDNPTRHVGIPT